VQKHYHPHNYSHIQQEQCDIFEQIVLDGKLDIGDYRISVPPSKEVCQDVEAWVGKNREQTRSKIANRLVTMFAFSLSATFVLVGLSSLVPQSDKGLLKDLIPLVVTPQVALLGVALGFYFDKD
jgi:hypothetical protein